MQTSPTKSSSSDRTPRLDNTLSASTLAARQNARAQQKQKVAEKNKELQAHVASLHKVKQAKSKVSEFLKEKRQGMEGTHNNQRDETGATATLEVLAGRDIPVITLVPKGYEHLLQV